MAAIVMCSSLTGCSLFIMAGKAILGDPMRPSQFRMSTGTDLTDGKDSVLIICTAPHNILSEFPSLQIDLLDRVTTRLDVRGIEVVPSNKVATWYDDHGEWGDFAELGSAFEAQYVMHIDLRQFTYKVPDSETLLQGRCEARVHMHEVRTGKSTETTVNDVFDRNVSVTFPSSYPATRENQSDEKFIELLINRCATEIAQLLYDHSMSDTIH